MLCGFHHGEEHEAEMGFSSGRGRTNRQWRPCPSFQSFLHYGSLLGRCDGHEQQSSSQHRGHGHYCSCMRSQQSNITALVPRFQFKTNSRIGIARGSLYQALESQPR
ncbi:hypothetical protein F442_04803 [Phytophthora nicotianae P10297]|uniref:Uncharacterized protein n=6 Tax=Phytophthora nicotianae TaxID=4792 RepID=W2R789_PHYN3|nr:hypothetical protein PPTG_01501 [Phytophthora nicotianae INRA-310]ETK85359.1 hypothetical protein L915_09800 [Phytophthora nicotianae]ETN21262.1 hypothetical protein PPTG_01501 [Phytophthora nicotianae INRA-310]ETO80788.1 hypothetical protein F444_04780 [Phytophthora nicotianae P1976]ETP49726.1 hypothetical protein F442_04803 [Phytophthora nicotianae P10297]